MLFSRQAVLTVVAVLTFISTGCLQKADDTPVAISPSTDEVPLSREHGHGDNHPTTATGAVAELSGLRDTIRDALANDDKATAHGPLHDVGHLLNEVKTLSAAEVTDPEQLKVIDSAIETLFASFGEVDAVMHGKEGKEYSEVSDDIDNAISAISKALPTANPEGEAPETDATETETDDV